MNRKLFVGLVAVVAYGVSAYLLNAGYPDIGLITAVFTASGAIALIVLEWSRV